MEKTKAVRSRRALCVVSGIAPHAAKGLAASRYAAIGLPGQRGAMAPSDGIHAKIALLDAIARCIKKLRSLARSFGCIAATSL